MKAINKELTYKLARKIISTILVISYFLTAYSVIAVHLIPTRYLIIALILVGIVIIYLAISNFKKQLKTKSIITVVISLIIIIINIYIFSAANSTADFFNNLQSSKYTFESYSIIAKTDRHISLMNVNKQNAGLLRTDKNNDLVMAEVNKKTNVYKNDYDEITSLTSALDNKSIDMAIIKSSYLQIIKENNDKYFQTIEVLTTFKIKIINNTATIKPYNNKPFVLYISGIDTYGSIDTVSRSDVNIMVVVNPKTHKILLINTPRDYYVQLHGTTGVKDKLTHSGIYGVDMSVNTMSDLYNVPINYYLRVNFSSLTNIINTLGGVNVYSEYNFTAQRQSFTEGYNQLNGEQALIFSRERHSFEGGDRTRGQNQQRVIEAIIAKMNDPATLLNYQSILSSLSGALQTNMSSDDISAIINNQLDSMSEWQTESISVTGTDSHNATYSMGNMMLYVMQPDIKSMNIAKSKIQQYIK